MNATTMKKPINWQNPADNEMVTLNDFRDMVREAELAPRITLEEFYKVTDEWLNPKPSSSY